MYNSKIFARRYFVSDHFIWILSRAHYNCIIKDSSREKNKYVSELNYMYYGFKRKKQHINSHNQFPYTFSIKIVIGKKIALTSQEFEEFRMLWRGGKFHKCSDTHTDLLPCLYSIGAATRRVQSFSDTPVHENQAGNGENKRTCITGV